MGRDWLQWFSYDQTWCAVFAGAVLKRSGNKYIQTASSQAYAGMVKKVLLTISKRRYIGISKGEKGTGHVAFATGNLQIQCRVVGGNQVIH